MVVRLAREKEQQEKPDGIEPVEDAALDIGRAGRRQPEKNDRMDAEAQDADRQSVLNLRLHAEHHRAGDDGQHDAQALDQAAILRSAGNRLFDFQGTDVHKRSVLELEPRDAA